MERFVVPCDKLMRLKILAPRPSVAALLTDVLGLNICQCVVCAIGERERDKSDKQREREYAGTKSA